MSSSRKFYPPVGNIMCNYVCMVAHEGHIKARTLHAARCTLLAACRAAAVGACMSQLWRRLINRPPDVCEAYLWQWGILAPPATSSRSGSSDRNPDTETSPRRGSVDSLGIIRINAGTWNKEMSHHNTDQLFISILCFTRWISWVIMDRRGCRSALLLWWWQIRARWFFVGQNNKMRAVKG